MEHFKFTGIQASAMDDFVKPSEINITTQPKQETEAGSGSSVALSVEASGEEGINLNYQWQFSADGATWADCTGVTAKTATYTFTMSLETAGSIVVSFLMRQERVSLLPKQ